MIWSNISNQKQSPYFNMTAPNKNDNIKLILAQKDWNNFMSYFYDDVYYTTISAKQIIQTKQCYVIN